MRNLSACTLSVLLWLLQPYPALAGPDPAVLTERASGKQLWTSPGWLNLLHYDRGKSLIPSSSSYFFSEHGAAQPEAEGQACLEKFWGRTCSSSDALTLADDDLRCRFPARYTFLARELGVAQPADVALQCPELGRWLSGINPIGLSLVFPGSYMNNPASMFGHTLLRIDSAEFSPDDPLLAAGVGFTADAGTERGIGYAAKGLWGAYPGYFTASPYYVQANMYGSLEDRDIWEYPLDLSREEATFFLLHVWELRKVGIPYYFLRRNCAFQLLAMLQVLRPEIDLTGRHRYWTLPVETVRQLDEAVGFRSSPVYRPSLSSRIQRAAKPLPGNLRKLGAALGRDSAALNGSAFERLSPEMQSCVLDLAMLYNTYLHVKQPEQRKPSPTVQHELATLRSSLPACNLQGTDVRNPVRPDQGHPSMRFSAGIGEHDGDLYLSLGGRPVLHDILDPAQGYIPGTGIELLDAELRYFPSLHRMRLESLDLITLQSTNPLEPLPGRPAWKVRLGLRRFAFPGTGDSLTLHGRAGAGRTTAMTRRGFGYALAGGAFWASDRIAGYGEIGPALELGWVLQQSESLLLGVQGMLSFPLLHDDQVRYQAGVTGTCRLTQKQAIRLEMTSENFVHSPTHSFALRWCFYF